MHKLITLNHKSKIVFILKNIVCFCYKK